MDMKTQRTFLWISLVAALAAFGCADVESNPGTGSGGSGGSGSGGSAGDDGDGGDGGDDGDVDTSGACGIICDGGAQMCVIEGFDPADGLENCTRDCQQVWINEQDCAGEADFVITCVDANGSCDTLEDETCGNFPESSALYELLQCLEDPSGS